MVLQLILCALFSCFVLFGAVFYLDVRRRLEYLEEEVPRRWGAQVAAFETRVKAVELAWEDAYAKLASIAGRIHKKAGLLAAEDGAHPPPKAVEMTRDQALSAVRARFQ